MHPVIRIVTFIVFSLGVVFGNVQHLLLALILMMAGYALWQPHLFKLNWQMLRRMRWLFLSILIIYLWFTPGQALFPATGAWSPSREGFQLGFYRVLSLVFIVLAVNLLIKSIARDELIASILWLLHPLRLLGLPDERLAVRIALTFDVVHQVQGMYGTTQSGKGKESLGSVSEDISPSEEQESDSSREVQSRSLITKIKWRLWSIGESAVGLFQQVLHQADNTPCHEVVINAEGRPPYYQWSYPIILAVLSVWLRHTTIV